MKTILATVQEIVEGKYVEAEKAAGTLTINWGVAPYHVWFLGEGGGDINTHRNISYPIMPI